MTQQKFDIFSAVKVTQ